MRVADVKLRRVGDQGVEPSRSAALRALLVAIESGADPRAVAGEVWRTVQGVGLPSGPELDTTVHFIIDLVEGVKRRVPLEEAVEDAIPDDGLERVATCLDLTLLERGAGRQTRSYEDLSERAADALRQAGLDVARAVAEAIGGAGSA